MVVLGAVRVVCVFAAQILSLGQSEAIWRPSSLPVYLP